MSTLLYDLVIGITLLLILMGLCYYEVYQLNGILTNLQYNGNIGGLS